MGHLKMGTLLMVILVAVVSCSEPEVEQPVTTGSAEMITSAETGSSPESTPETGSSSTTTAARTGVLVFHRTEGFRHDSIEAGIEALVELGESKGYRVTATDDSSIFSASDLEAFQVIVFLNTTGNVLVETQQLAMEEFIRSGRGFVGIHSAADTEYDWEWYGGLVGAYFNSHPVPQSAAVRIITPHPVVKGLPERFERFDEWYDFRSHPGPGVTVLATVDESTYEGGAMGPEHPIVWAHEYEGGRAVYVGFGHTAETYEESLVLTLLDNAIRWAGGLD